MERLTDGEFGLLLTVVANDLKSECEAFMSAMDRGSGQDRVAHYRVAMQLSTILLKLNDARRSDHI